MKLRHTWFTPNPDYPGLNDQSTVCFDDVNGVMVYCNDKAKIYSYSGTPSLPAGDLPCACPSDAGMTKDLLELFGVTPHID